MRWSPRRSMLRLAQPLMSGCVAALSTALRAEGLRPFTPATAVLELASATQLD